MGAITKRIKYRAKRWWKGILYHKKIAISLFIGVVLLVVGVYVFARNFSDRSTAKLYKQQVGNLSTAVNNLPSDLKRQGSTQANLNSYFDELSALIVPCAQMVAAHDARIERIRSPELKDAMNQTNKLCGDLRDVSVYSQNVYAASQNYLYYQPNWPAVSDQNFPAVIADLDSVVKNTKDKLQHVDSKNIQDPGLSELTNLLDTEEQTIAQIQDALKQNNVKQAVLMTDQLDKQLRRDQTNFLNARIYYWDNTIEYNQLQKAVNKLKGTFNALKV